MLEQRGRGSGATAQQNDSASTDSATHREGRSTSSSRSGRAAVSQPKSNPAANDDVVQQMLRERLQERIVRKANADRLSRLDAVAMEAKHRTSAGITEDLLRRKQTRRTASRTDESADESRSSRATTTQPNNGDDGGSSSSGDEDRAKCAAKAASIGRVATEGEATSCALQSSSTGLSANALRGLNAFTDPRRRGVDSQCSDVASVRSLGPAANFVAQQKRQGTTLGQDDAPDETASVSARSAPPALGEREGSAPLQGPRAVVRRVDRLSGNLTNTALPLSNPLQAESDHDEDDGMENGGHVCVVTTHAQELLFSRSSSAPMLTVPSKECGRALAGAPPPSLRSHRGPVSAATAARTLSKELEEDTSAHVTAASGPAAAPAPPAKRSNSSAAAMGRPGPFVRSEGWTNNYGGGPKSILKRHPIPRKHSRRVKFFLESSADNNNTFLSSNNSSLRSNNSSLRLSKDGPPVAFSLPDVCGSDVGTGATNNDRLLAGATDGVDGESDWNHTVVIPRGKAPAGSLRPEKAPNARGGRGDSGGGWGADSDVFNQEWGLPSPNVADAKPQRRNGRGGPRGGDTTTADESRRQLLSSLTFHTGLSMEEARLLTAIAAVNTKLREAGGFHAELTKQSAAEQLAEEVGSRRQPSHTAEVARGRAVAPAVVVARGLQQQQPPPQTFVSGGDHHAGGVVVVDPSRAARRGTSAPPPASTSRNAPAPTQRRENCQVVVAPQEEGLPENILAALPRRKSEHQALTRRDRFGKKMSVVGR